MVSALRSSRAEEDAAGKSHCWNSFFETALGKKLHRGVGAGKQLEQARQRWAEGKGGAPALYTQDTGALLNKIRVFVKERWKESQRSPYQLKGAPTSLHLYGYPIILWSAPFYTPMER